MSAAVNLCLDWLRRHLAWSNSRQSWEERLGIAVLLGGAGCLLGLSRHLSLAQQAVLWGLLVLALALLLRRGWLKLFGPVLLYDLVRAGRRRRFFAFRAAYAVLLLLLLCFVNYLWFLNSERHGGRVRASDMASFAETFFYTFMVVQFLMVTLLAPAFAAGAITDEKERKTLEFLLATDLRNREIVLSKLVSRLASLVFIILTGLPILSILQLLGGVDPGMVLAGFAATGLTVLSLVCLSILSSVLYQRSRDAIVFTYLFAAGYILLSLLSWLLLVPGLGMRTTDLSFGAGLFTTQDLVEWINAGNIISAIAQLFSGNLRGLRPDEILPSLFRDYAVFHGALALLCSCWAVTVLRSQALKQTYGKAQKAPWSVRLFGRPPVGNLPMLWKEIFVESGTRLNWIGRIIVALLFVGSFVPAVCILIDFFQRVSYRSWGDPWKMLAMEMRVMHIGFVGTSVLVLMLLAVAVRAASSISGERDRQTLDSLYTTPLDSHSILFAKWLGCLLSVRWAWIWIALLWLLGLVTGGLHILALPLLLTAWLVFAAFVANLGLWYSTVCRSGRLATAATILTLVGICALQLVVLLGTGLALATLQLRHAGWEWVLSLQAGLMPPFVLGWLGFCGQEFEGGGEDFRPSVQFTVFSLLGLFLWGGAAAGLWSMASQRFRVMSGRIPLRRPRRGIDASRSVLHLSAAAGGTALPSVPLPPRHPQGAVLIDEEWTEPRTDPRPLGPRGAICIDEEFTEDEPKG